MMLVVCQVKDPASVSHALRDSTLPTTRLIVKSVRLVPTVVEEYVLNVILEPSLLQVLDIVLLAVVDTSVMMINE